MRDLWQLDPATLPWPLRTVAEKELHLWVPAWIKDRARKRLRRRPRTTRHLLFAVCDHYEPLQGNGTTLSQGLERVRAWRKCYPELARQFRDASGRPPRHSFFYPGEQYDPALVEPLAELVAMDLGEVEVHLHHDGDTRTSLRKQLEDTVGALAAHGVIPSRGGRPAWAFIHGNWCLANARRDRRWCGVDDELALLHELGCYADFTFPAAQDQSQPGIVNAIYYPTGDVRRRRAYEDGESVRVGTRRQERVLLIQGPIALSRRPPSLRPRIESAALDWADPPTPARLHTWLRQEICVRGREEWVFVKVHTHGAPERNAAVLLEEPMRELHRAMAQYNDGTRWRLHYVSAREMYNLARAAMDGCVGSPVDFLDYEIPRPPRLPSAQDAQGKP